MGTMNDGNDTYSSGEVARGFTGLYKPFSSPYLNYDPIYMPPSQPEYIFLDGNSKQRGRFELAFGQIGASCMIGAGIGGGMGLYNGLKATTLEGQTGKLRRTQLLNHIMKKGSATANTLGSIAVIYSAFGVILSWARGADDDLNTIAAATATGFLYKSTGHCLVEKFAPDVSHCTAAGIISGKVDVDEVFASTSHKQLPMNPKHLLVKCFGFIGSGTSTLPLMMPAAVQCETSGANFSTRQWPRKIPKKQISGIRKCGLGGAVGFGISALYAFWNNREKLAELRQFNPA